MRARAPGKSCRDPRGPTPKANPRDARPTAVSYAARFILILLTILDKSSPRLSVLSPMQMSWLLDY
jgi:hypothetical protein